MSVTSLYLSDANGIVYIAEQAGNGTGLYWLHQAPSSTASESPPSPADSVPSTERPTDDAQDIAERFAERGME